MSMTSWNCERRTAEVIKGLVGYNVFAYVVRVDGCR